LTDTEAVARVQAGDQDAYRVLVERHAQSVFRLAFRITRNEQDAEDLVQEAFLRAYRHIAAFDGRASFLTWIYRIAANASLDVVRGRKRTTAELPEFSDPRPTPEREAAGRQMHARLERAMDDLTTQERTAFVMRHFENLSIAEIAQSLDLRENATKHSIFRAVRKLRAALGEAI
jgi:RNA polymerase sigma-70 factor (ECF subfamily)